MSAKPAFGQSATTLRARLASGAACAAVIGLALVPLAPHPAAGQTVGSGDASAAAGPSALPASSVLCPTPVVTPPAGASTAVSTETSPGSGVYTGPPNGPQNTWIQIVGSNLSSANCTTSVTIGAGSPVVAQSTPPDLAPNATAPAPGTAIWVKSPGDSGAVTVTLTDATQPVTSSGANTDQTSYTFLTPPQIGAISTTNPTEGQSIAVTGSGFTLGKLSDLVGVTYFNTAATAGNECAGNSVKVTDDTHLAMLAAPTYCHGPAAVMFETQADTTKPLSSSNVNTVQAVTAQVLQVRAVIGSLNPAQPSAGGILGVSGSGFGQSGSATLGGTPLTVNWWSDRGIVLAMPDSATTGQLVLIRADGSQLSGGTLAVLAAPVAGSPGNPTSVTGNATVAAAALAAASGVKGPSQFTVGGPGHPANGGLRLPGGVSRAVLPLTPIVSAAVTSQPTPVQLSVFAAVSIALLIAAFLLGFLNAGRVWAYARRRRRASALGAAAVDNPAKARVRGSELRLGRYLRSLEVVGRETPLGHLLLKSGLIDRHELGPALRQHREERRPLGEVLVARGRVSEEDVWRTLGEQWNISSADLNSHWIDTSLAHRLAPVDSIRYRVLPLRAIGDTVVLAMADPFDTRARLHAERCLGASVVPILVSPSALRRKQEEVYAESLLVESVDALRIANPQASAHELTTKPQRIAAIATGVLALGLAILFGGRFFIGIAGCIVALYAVVVTFRTYVIVRGAKYRNVISVSQDEMAALTDLPVYTILCPLYREKEVLPQLVDACSKLDYPSSLLDVKLLLEADDTETLEAVEQYPLPPYFDVVIVPAEGPRTKPKACNYGLQFARGEYVVIFDAEDIPDPDQLKKAVATFRRSGPEIGCVQAKLNFYNHKQNALTGWFALEYTAWFDFFLPGLVDLGMPVPLGGSSNHFPTALLRELNAWDPNNVTEDADLGMRLHRAGYRTVITESTTLEEANSDFVNWIKQRSRWGKGYAVSWLVQMRHPADLYKQLGFKGFVAVQLTLGGTFGVAVLNLFVWLLTLLWFLAQFNFIAYLFPSGIYYVGMVELLFGNFFFLYMGVWSCQHRGSWELTRLSLLAPVYWLMMSLAMLKAGLQLVTKPTYWEKTVHGLYTHEPVETADADLDGVASQHALTATAPDGAAAVGVAEEVAS